MLLTKRSNWAKKHNQAQGASALAMGAVEEEGQPLSRSAQEQIVEKFVCQHPGCGKVFSNKMYLTGHMRYHKTRLDFPCPVPHC